MPPAGSRPRLVLVVEDDPQAGELFRSTLRNHGYAVIAVEDGVDALRYVESHTPAAVVLDLGLPRLHGRDVHREMAAHGLTAKIPVIVVTGDAADLNEQDFSCVLRKPVSPDELRASRKEVPSETAPPLTRRGRCFRIAQAQKKR